MTSNYNCPFGRQCPSYDHDSMKCTYLFRWCNSKKFFDRANESKLPQMINIPIPTDDIEPFSQQKQNGENQSVEGNEKSVNLSTQSKDNKTADIYALAMKMKQKHQERLGELGLDTQLTCQEAFDLFQENKDGRIVE